MQDQQQYISSINFEVLDRKISYQANTWSALSKELTIKEALLEIQSSKHQRKPPTNTILFSWLYSLSFAKS